MKRLGAAQDVVTFEPINEHWADLSDERVCPILPKFCSAQTTPKNNNNDGVSATGNKMESKTQSLLLNSLQPVRENGSWAHENMKSMPEGSVGHGG